MSRLLVVRHGQASAGSEDYDRLSALGKRQAGILGEHWARVGFRPDRVVAGTHRRHLESAESAGRGFIEAGGRWPEPEPLAAFDEHDGYDVVLSALSELRATDPKIRAWGETLENSTEPDPATFWTAFRFITHLWARGRLELDGNSHEPWQVFRSRVEGGLDELSEDVRSGRSVVVFTSAGPSGVAAAAALGLDHGGAIELSWKVWNAAVTELEVGSEGLELKSFNSASHLPRAELVTMI